MQHTVTEEYHSIDHTIVYNVHLAYETYIIYSAPSLVHETNPVAILINAHSLNSVVKHDNHGV